MKVSVIQISDAYMYYNLILRVNINMHATCHLHATQALAWARVALPHGLACHVASTWVPRENKPLFTFILLFLID